MFVYRGCIVLGSLRSNLCAAVYTCSWVCISVWKNWLCRCLLPAINPRHGNPKIYPQISMQPPSTNLLKIWWIIIGGGTSRYRVRSDSRHCSAMKNKHTWIGTAVECIDKKGYIWWTHEQELDRQNIPICMQPRKKWECICICITLLLCARVSQKWDDGTFQHRKD